MVTIQTGEKLNCCVIEYITFIENTTSSVRSVTYLNYEMIPFRGTLLSIFSERAKACSETT